MAHFDIPLDIPHAGRVADRLLTLLGSYIEELNIEAPEALEAAEKTLVIRRGVAPARVATVQMEVR